MKIHEVIRKNRKERGLTQEELAKYLGVSTPAVNKWEKGLSYPDITLLPVLAAYFNISVDELLGYEPQMVKEDIRKLYHEMARRFGSEPYETVKAACDEYIKKYHACFPLLMQMAVLLLNHFQLAPNPPEVLEEVNQLLDCVIENGEEIRVIKEAMMLKGSCCLMMQKPEEILDMLGEQVQAIPQDQELQAMAFQIKGDSKKAKATLQVAMYQHLLTLIGDTTVYISWEQEASEKTEEIIRRTLELMDLFHVEQLHFNVAAQVYLTFARYECIAQRPEKALEFLERYAGCMMAEKLPLKLHGDSYFDKVDDWLEELSLGKEAPTSEERLKQNVLQSVAGNPAFECLKEYPRFTRLIRRLEEYCGKTG